MKNQVTQEFSEIFPVLSIMISRLAFLRVAHAPVFWAIISYFDDDIFVFCET
jgi:hypothetical protein